MQPKYLRVFFILTAFVILGILLFSLYNTYKTENPVVTLRNETIDCFSNDILSFLDFSIVKNLGIFIIDQVILRDLVVSQELDEYIRNGMISETHPKCSEGHILELGVLASNLQELDFCEKIAALELRCESGSRGEGFDGHLELLKSSRKFVAHYMIYLNDDKVIHLAVFQASENFMFVGYLNQSLQKWDRKIFGSHGAEVFDLFEVSQVRIALPDTMSSATNTSMIDLKVPTELGHFLSQVNTSRYIGCQGSPVETAVTGHARLKRKSRDEHFVNSLKTMKNLAKHLRIPIWLASGTLLGWYRECGFTPYTPDTDFATWSRFANARVENSIKGFIESSFLNKFGLKIVKRFGRFEKGFELTMKADGIPTDLFFTYDEGDHFTYYGHVPVERVFIQSLYPKFDLCSGVLLGHKVLVPCSALDVVQAEYGPEWKSRIKKWNYSTSPHNLGPRQKWPSNFTEKDFFIEFSN